jgi:hypothetical protein
MTIKISDSLKEALKEGARVVVLAIIPLLADSLGKGAIDWQLIGVAGAIALLRFVDSWLHQSGVHSGGLTQF